MITAVDEQIGRLLATLDELGLAEDTIVWVSSDHGDMLGSQGLRLKRKPWEESIHVPGIVRYPRKVLGARDSDVLLTQVDFAPTWLGLCGVKAPAGMQGTDLSAVVLGPVRARPRVGVLRDLRTVSCGGRDGGLAWRPYWALYVCAP